MPLPLLLLLLRTIFRFFVTCLPTRSPRTSPRRDAATGRRRAASSLSWTAHAASSHTFTSTNGQLKEEDDEEDEEVEVEDNKVEDDTNEDDVEGDDEDDDDDDIDEDIYSGED